MSSNIVLLTSASAAREDMKNDLLNLKHIKGQQGTPFPCLVSEEENGVTNLHIVYDWAENG